MRKRRWYDHPGTCILQSRRLLDNRFNYWERVHNLPDKYNVPLKQEVQEVLNILELALKTNPSAKVARLGPFSVKRVDFVYGYEDPKSNDPPKPLAEYQIEVE